MKKLKIFVDSDVVIASLLSTTGAAYYLLHKAKLSEVFISTYSQKELHIVMGIEQSKLNILIEEGIVQIKTIKESIEEVKRQYGMYVLDENDAHIVAGVAVAKANFLVTYNTKDFKSDRIKDSFDCIVTTPANFLQYLRSS